jgi:hypothetical protein
VFIPWGDFDWILGRLRNENWRLVGCIAHEERSMSILRRAPWLASGARFVRIFDEDPEDSRAEEASLDLRADDAIGLEVPSARIVDADLLATIDEIGNLVSTSSNETDSIILDLSCFPKRWFFALIRFLFYEPRFRNIIATYSIGQSYGKKLSDNPEIARTLPTFASEKQRSECDVAVLSIGFDTNSIIGLLDIERPRAVRVLFPFPPGPPGIRRNWQFLESLQRSIKTDVQRDRELGSRFDYLHVGAVDVPNNFDAVCRSTNGGEKTSLLAPYGPKPVSLSMCMYALAAERAGKKAVPVYYSQPKRYALDYTQGVVEQAGSPVVYAYPIRLGGRDLYRL